MAEISEGARKAAEDIMPDAFWFPTEEQSPGYSYEAQLSEKSARIQQAIDTALAEQAAEVERLRRALAQARIAFRVHGIGGLSKFAEACGVEPSQVSEWTAPYNSPTPTEASE